ncbi:MAG: efflux transporter periplasmic adaptor subunit [Chromatiales bacterium]|nr:MAG: efflux transporter periplasmic adaptor subunit [Chromatiales bacterium]
MKDTNRNCSRSAGPPHSADTDISSRNASMSNPNIFARKPWILAVIIAVAVTLWMLSGEIGEPPRSPAGADTADTSDPSLAEVRVRRVASEPVVRYVTINGRTEPSRTVALDAQTDGRVVEIFINRGQPARRGAAILKLDERDRAARLSEARAVLKQRELEFEARQKLKLEGYVSETQLAEGEALLERARAEVKRAELDLERMVVSAPFNGNVQDLMVEVGDYLQVGDPVAEFVDNETLLVSGSVSEMERDRLAGNETGEVRLVTGATASGKIRYLAPVADAATRTFRVEVAIDNRERRLPSGVTAELRLPVGEVDAHLVSPALLSLDDDGKVGVKILDEDGRVVFVNANVAASTADGIWLAGLPHITTFVTVGHGFVSDGERVVAIQEEPGATAVASEKAE